MKIDRDVVQAYTDEYELDVILEMRRLALKAVAEQLPRVEFTSASFDLGGASGVFVNGKPEYLVKLFSAVKKKLENKAAGAVDRRNRSMIHGDLSGREAGW